MIRAYGRSQSLSAVADSAGSGTLFDIDNVTLPGVPRGLEEVTDYEYVDLRGSP
jgi:hypothetical protein